MKKQSIQTILYSTVGVVAMAIILVVANVIAGTLGLRLDLTQEKAYTLSRGTRNILAGLDGSVRVRFYCSQGESTGDTMQLRDYAKNVEALLDEYKHAAKGKLVIERLDPEPDTDAEDKAQADGIDAFMVNGQAFYLGLAVSQLDEKQTVPLSPNRERLLEYDLTRAIYRVTTPEKPVIGIMSPLPVFGRPAAPMMMQMSQEGQQPWFIVSDLSGDFTVRPIPMDTDTIDDAIKTLVVIHPRDITDKAQYAIDQFVLRGGKLLAFLDPVPQIIDSQRTPQIPISLPGSGSSLDKLLKAWGLSFDTGRVVADMTFKMRFGNARTGVQEAPAALAVSREGLDTDDIVTSQIPDLWLPYAGAFTGTPAPGLTETVLARSTKQSQLIEGNLANGPSQAIMSQFKPSGVQYALAVRLSGKFKTAFPDGKPEEKKEVDASEAKPNEKPATPDSSLKESKQESTVILVGDADMLSEQINLEQTLFGIMVRNGNFSFVENAIDQLSGDNNLIAIRSRATTDRPLTKVREMEAAADLKAQSVNKDLEDKKAETQHRLDELQQKKTDKEQRLVLSPEQMLEVNNLRKEKAECDQKIRQANKDLRSEKVALQTTIKCVNILAVPLAVACSGIMIATIKRRKTSAK